MDEPLERTRQAFHQSQVLERLDTLLAPCGEQALIRAILQAHNGRIRSARRLLAPLLDDQVTAVVAHTTVDAGC